VRRGIVIAAVAVLTVAAVLGVLAFFNSRDDSTIGEDRAEPGVPAPDATGRTLEQGNVVFVYGEPAHREPLRTLAADISGPPDEALIHAGQSILVQRKPGAAGVVAEAYRRRLEVASPRDPALREFAEHWLGRGAMP
jgi:hypothetical protein